MLDSAGSLLACLYTPGLANLAFGYGLFSEPRHR